MADVESFLAHHGVKGQRWGVINEDKPSLRSYLKELPKIQKLVDRMPQVQKAKDVADGEKENLEKAGFKFTKKNVAIGVGITLGVAAISYAGYRAYTGQPILPGKPISAQAFRDLAYGSKLNTWAGQNFIRPSSYDRPGFTLPKGHEFHRITMLRDPGSVFKDAAGTYASHSIDDYNRYVHSYVNAASTPGGKFDKAQRYLRMYHTSFVSNQEIKVPNLKETLDVFTESVRKNGGAKATPSEILDAYRSRVGGAWDDDVSKTFFKDLVNRGYHAFVDDKDEGVISDSPLVLLSKEMFSDIKSEPLTDSIVDKSEAALKEILRRKT